MNPNAFTSATITFLYFQLVNAMTVGRGDLSFSCFVAEAGAVLLVAGICAVAGITRQH